MIGGGYIYIYYKKLIYKIKNNNFVGLPVPEDSFVDYDASKYSNNSLWAIRVDKFEVEFDK
jgi:hypothetical protein